MPIRRTLVIAMVAALGAGGCLRTLDPGTPSAEQFALRIGLEAALLGGPTRLAMTDVESDSRCPVDVQCVQAGNAVVVLGSRAGTGPTTVHRLNTTVEPRSMSVPGYFVRLDSLLPHPRSDQVIKSANYVAHLTVERSGVGNQ